MLNNQKYYSFEKFCSNSKECMGFSEEWDPNIYDDDELDVDFRKSRLVCHMAFPVQVIPCHRHLLSVRF